MADELCASLAAHGRSGRTIGIKVRLDDFTTVTRAHTLAEPTCDVEQVDAVALRLLDEYAPAAAGAPARRAGGRPRRGRRGRAEDADAASTGDGARRRRTARRAQRERRTSWRCGV